VKKAVEKIEETTFLTISNSEHDLEAEVKEALA
jgi:hypothetical protein